MASLKQKVKEKKAQIWQQRGQKWVPKLVELQVQFQREQVAKQIQLLKVVNDDRGQKCWNWLIARYLPKFCANIYPSWLQHNQKYLEVFEINVLYLLSSCSHFYVNVLLEKKDGESPINFSPKDKRVYFKEEK